MSYTNVHLVKQHVRVEDMPLGSGEDYPVTFVGLDWVNLPGRGIKSNSVTIKAVRENSPTCEQLVLGNDAAVLLHARLVLSSVTVASDTSLGTVYSENSDYVIDAVGGTIMRLPSGNIPASDTVAVWYYYYSPYVEGSDFQVDYQSGRVRRLSSSVIQEGQAVLVDYELSLSDCEDEIIAAAVTEANAIVESMVDPRQLYRSDRTLQTATTFLAVSIVCRSAAAFGLTSGLISRQNTPGWLSLAESYRTDYEQLLKSFRPGAARLKSPTHS